MDIVESMKKTLGISCVEVYLLALYEKAGIDTKSLFVDSFIEPQTVMEGFLKYRCNYTTYAGLKRLQDIAKRQGLANLYFYRDGEELPYYSPKRALNIYARGGMIVLLKGVRPDYKQSSFMPWREDHYLLQHEKQIYDCYPPSKLDDIDAKHYDGRNIRMEIVKTDLVNFSPSTRPKTMVDYAEEVKKTVRDNIQRPLEFSAQQEDLQYLRDALLIVKTSRRRLNEILCSEIIKEQIAELGKLIAIIETCRLRGRIINILSNLQRINQLEKAWREGLINA